jgi:hypothetical protein
VLQEIMDFFQSNAFSALLIHLGDLECQFRNKVREGQVSPTEGELEISLEEIASAIKVCAESGFDNGKAKASLSRTQVNFRKENIDYSTLATELRSIRDMMMVDFWKRKFVQISTEFVPYTEPRFIGLEIRQAFPFAVDDLKDAGNCIAVGLGTAAVFHLMRAVEWAIRAFCKKLGITKVPKSNKPGNKKYIAVEYSQWEKIFTAMREKINEKIDKMKPSPTKQAAQEFYYPLLQDIHGFKEAWRNHVMHTRRNFSVKDADAICDYVQRFMTTLAPKVKK